MPKRLVEQVNFNAGELSPRLYSRKDINKFENGLETATNCYVVPHGPIVRRSGSEYIATVKDSSKTVRLVRFQFSATVAIIIEMGDQYMRFFTSKAVINDSTEFTNGTFDSDISGWSDNSSGTGAISFNTDHMDIVGAGGGNEARAYQILNLGTSQYTVTVTTSAALTYNIGTSLGATDIATGSVNGTAQTFSFTPSAAGNVYIEFENANSDTRELDSVSIDNPLYQIDSPYTEAQIDEVTYVQSGNQIYFAHEDVQPKVLTRTNNDQWVFSNLDALPEPTYEAGDEPAATLTPAATTGFGVNFTASAAIFIDADVGRQIIHKEGVGRGSIVSFTSTTVVVVDILEDFPNTNAIASGDWKIDLSPIAALTPDGTKLGSIVNVTADVTGTSTTALNTFRTGDVGKYILMSGGVLQIIQRNSASDVDCEVLKSLTTLDETENWTLEVATWDATRGFPRAVGLFQERLIYASTVAQPQTIWFSETNIFTGFGVGTADADSIEVTLNSSQINEINWFAVGRDLIVGTSGAEFTVDGGSASAITPTSIRQTPRTYHGSDRQKPITIGAEVVFIQNSETKIRSFRYDFNLDGYIGEDLTFLAEHITENKVSEAAYSQEPNSIIYAVLDNGDMLTGTYVRDQKVIGWTKYTSTGSFENVETITSGIQDQVWVVVNRTVNGSTVRYIEVFDNGNGTDRLHGFSDSFLTYSAPKTITGITQANPAVVTATAHGLSDGNKVKLIDVGGMTEVINKTYLVANKTANTFELTDTTGTNINSTAFTAYTSGGEAHKLVTTISGLDHLEAETVQIKADGADHADKTVSSGAITLSSNSYEVVVGLSYTTTIKTLSIDYDIGLGSMQGQRVRWARPLLRVSRSARPLLNGEFIPARTPSDEMDLELPLVTGDLEYGPLNWDTSPALTITLSDPLPLVLTGIFGVIDSGVK